MFHSIVTDRPWPATGMTTEKWKQVPAFPVLIGQLTATQDGVKLDAVKTIMKSPGYISYCGDRLPHVVSWRGILYLEDGHHRAVAAALGGKSEIFARIYTVIDHGE